LNVAIVNYGDACGGAVVFGLIVGLAVAIALGLVLACDALFLFFVFALVPDLPVPVVGPTLVSVVGPTVV